MGTGFSCFRVYGMHALVLICGQGAGRYRDERGTDRRVGPGDLIVVFPDLGHQYGPEPGDVWDEIFVTFDGAAFEGWRGHGLDPAQPVWALPPLPDDGWAKRFAELPKMPGSTQAESCAAVAAVHALIADLVAVKASAIDAGPAWLEPACRALSEGAGGAEVPEVARRAGMSYETFRKSFKAATGESPARYRRRHRLAQAALMLQRMDLSLEVIARALGFCDAFHLSKAFKQQHGVAPLEWRRRIERSEAG